MNNYPCNNVKVPISGWVNLHPFKAWCLQILPTIFDESMSYYECLCKLLDIMSATIDDVNLLGQEFVKLKEYVDNYFNNLDVQTEINNKLDEMVADGTFQRLLATTRGWSVYSGAAIIFLGGEFWHNSTYKGLNIPGHLSAGLVTKNIDLTANNISLLTPGSDYYSRLSNWINDTANKDMIPFCKYIFVAPTQKDLERSNEEIQQALYNLLSLIPSAQLFVFPGLYDYYSPTKQQQINLKKVYKLKDFGGVHLILPNHILVTNNSFIVSRETINSDGVRNLIAMYINALTLKLYQLDYGSIIQEKSGVKFTCYGGEGRLYADIRGNNEELLTFNIPYYSDSQINISLPNYLSLNSGLMIIQDNVAKIKLPAGDFIFTGYIQL